MWLEEKKYNVGKTDFNPLIALWLGFGVTMGIIIVLLNITMRSVVGFLAKVLCMVLKLEIPFE